VRKIGSFIDVSGRSIVSLVGAESLDLLQRISTNDVTKLSPGGTIQTVLLNEKGRIVDVVSVLDRREKGLLILGQSLDSATVKKWIEKFVIMENITVNDLTGEIVHFVLYEMIQSVEDLIRSQGVPDCQVFKESLASVQLTHLLVEKESRGSMLDLLAVVGIVQSTEVDFEEYRVSHGIPRFPHELSASYNPLEAGLLSLVSFTKGCYIGQEVVARLDTYKKVQKVLVGLRLEGFPPELPEKIYLGEEELGVITSAVQLRDTHECLGMGYVRSGFESTNENLYFKNGSRHVRLTIGSLRSLRSNNS
jgi:tRNA-modifying protein YgfZ